MGLVEEALNNSLLWSMELFDDLEMRGATGEIDYAGLPPSLRSGMKIYVEDGIVPGHFLTAVLMDYLKEAVLTADDQNIILLPRIVRWCVYQLPTTAWGSPEEVRAWIALRKLEGIGEGP